MVLFVRSRIRFRTTPYNRTTRFEGFLPHIVGEATKTDLRRVKNRGNYIRYVTAHVLLRQTAEALRYLVTIAFETEEEKMKEIRLIKHKDVQKQEAAEKAANKNLVQNRNTIEVVREWVEERRVSQKEQARQMFSSLFAQPQPE